MIILTINVFLLGTIGSAFRIILTERNKNGLFVANLIGIIVAAILINFDSDLLILALAGSMTTLSSLIVAKHQKPINLIFTLLLYLITFLILSTLVGDFINLYE